MIDTCTHTRVEAGPYSDIWETTCGKKYRISGPVEVGMGFNPDPSGNFCSNCGARLVIDRWSKIEERW